MSVLLCPSRVLENVHRKAMWTTQTYWLAGCYSDTSLFQKPYNPTFCITLQSQVKPQFFSKCQRLRCGNETQLRMNKISITVLNNILYKHSGGILIAVLLLHSVLHYKLTSLKGRIRKTCKGRMDGNASRLKVIYMTVVKTRERNAGGHYTGDVLSVTEFSEIPQWILWICKYPQHLNTVYDYVRC